MVDNKVQNDLDAMFVSFFDQLIHVLVASETCIDLSVITRVHLNAGEKETFEIEIDKDALQIVDEEGKRYIDSDEFSVYIGTSQPDRRSERLLKRKPLELRFNIE